MTLAIAIPAMLVTAALGGAAETSLAALGWLAGSWVSEEGDRRIEEHWIPAAGGTMLGLSRTVAGNETVGFEFLRLESRPTGIFYIAHPGARPGTEFALTRLEGQEAVFENPAHDHPKIIRYRLESDGTLLAVIEGDENGKHVRQDFHYRKAPP